MSLATPAAASPAAQPVRRKAWWSWLLDAVAAAFSLVLGFNFGLSLAGPWLGIIMGANAAIFASLMTSSLLGRWAYPPAPSA